MSRTGPRSSWALLPWGWWCVLVIATFSPDSSSLQFSSTFWKLLLLVLIKVSPVSFDKSLSLTFASVHFYLHGFMFSCAKIWVVSLQQTFFPLFFMQHKIAGAKQFQLFFCFLIKLFLTKPFKQTASEKICKLLFHFFFYSFAKYFFSLFSIRQSIFEVFFRCA